MFEVERYEKGLNNASGQFVFGAGGNQGGEGRDFAAEWFISNVKEELDAPNEFW